jgi:hypothetical protein
MTTPAEAAVEARIIEEQAPEMEAQVAAEDTLPTAAEMPARKGRGRPRKTAAEGETPKPRAPRKPRTPRAEKAKPAADTNTEQETNIATMDVSGTSVSAEPETERQLDTTWSPSSDSLTGTDENNVTSDSQDQSGE